jgi:hypothetical protein
MLAIKMDTSVVESSFSALSCLEFNLAYFFFGYYFVGPSEITLIFVMCIHAFMTVNMQIA